MITFTDDHEAELWRSVAAGMIVTLSVAPSSPGPLDIAAHAGLFADAAVLEYRKRCGLADTTTTEVECTECEEPTVIPAGDNEAKCRYCEGQVTR